MVASVLVAVGLLLLAIRAGLDVFTISLALLCAGAAAALLWLVLRQTTPRRRIIWLAALAVWIVVSVPITWVFASPYVTFELATLQCGHQPVVATNFAAGYRYSLPGDHDYGPSMFDNTYYCSAGNAEAAGYRRR